MLRETLVVFAAFLALAAATQVNQCGTGRRYDDTDAVQISGCSAPPCILRRKTSVLVEQKFVPDHDVQNLRTSVHATILGLPLPFVGVDGTDACGNVFNLDGTPAGCPLKKGTEYHYKREFPVLEIYPKVSPVVYWALTENDNPITCFEVPAKIT
ncbi:protein NPC2 homolog [Orussus abietinus]|uniref:protein NPC2 homolog n=1 Tax=Orussus abietinus TaxID=222816 RepID=UPI000626AE26|nr:protein NPC2 homolog [Orussus abietinus]